LTEWASCFGKQDLWPVPGPSWHQPKDGVAPAALAEIKKKILLRLDDEFAAEQFRSGMSADATRLLRWCVPEQEPEQWETPDTSPFLRRWQGDAQVSPANILRRAEAEFPARLNDGIRRGIAVDLDDAGVVDKHGEPLVLGTKTPITAG
jgi:hypothetical protein